MALQPREPAVAHRWRLGIEHHCAVEAVGMLRREMREHHRAAAREDARPRDPQRVEDLEDVAHVVLKVIALDHRCEAKAGPVERDRTDAARLQRGDRHRGRSPKHVQRAHPLAPSSSAGVRGGAGGAFGSE